MAKPFWLTCYHNNKPDRIVLHLIRLAGIYVQSSHQHCTPNPKFVWQAHHQSFSLPGHWLIQVDLYPVNPLTSTSLTPGSTNVVTLSDSLRGSMCLPVLSYHVMVCIPVHTVATQVYPGVPQHKWIHVTIYIQELDVLPGFQMISETQQCHHITDTYGVDI